MGVGNAESGSGSGSGSGSESESANIGTTHCDFSSWADAHYSCICLCVAYVFTSVYLCVQTVEM
jgi:hypothetical protein